jgi:putative DNA primase/helicase
VLTNRGERILWGKDLERAIARSATKPKIGDLIGARRIGGEAVAVMSRQGGASGRLVSEGGHLPQRNRWVVEKVQFFAERAKLARRVREAQMDCRSTMKGHPELLSTYLTLRGAQEVAERRIADPRDRERFLTLVREAIASSVKGGEPLPAVRLRGLAKHPDELSTPAGTPRGDDPVR